MQLIRQLRGQLSGIDPRGIDFNAGRTAALRVRLDGSQQAAFADPGRSRQHPATAMFLNQEQQSRKSFLMRSPRSRIYGGFAPVKWPAIKAPICQIHERYVLAEVFGYGIRLDL
jgi:hypothetical protein